MKTEVLSLDDIARWRALYDDLKFAGVYSHPAYLELLEGHFEDESERVELFILQSSDEFVYYPYFKRRLDDLPYAEHTDRDLSEHWDIVSSWYFGGPLLSDGPNDELALKFADAFSEYCRDSNIVSEFIRFDPSIENYEWFDSLGPEFNRETVMVDMTKSKEEIWDEYTSSNRTLVRQGQDSEIEVHPSTDISEWRAFHDIYSNAMDAKGATDHYRFSKDFFDTIRTEYDDISTCFVAMYDEEVIGGFIVVHDRSKVHAYLRASEPDYWDMRVNNLLCHEAMMHMYDQGFDLFDFQGGRPGVFDFKKKFSPDRGQFYLGKRTHMPDVFDELLEVAGDHGVEMDKEYFPQYRVAKSN